MHAGKKGTPNAIDKNVRHMECHCTQQQILKNPLQTAILWFHHSRYMIIYIKVVGSGSDILQYRNSRLDLYNNPNAGGTGLISNIDGSFGSG